MVPHGRARGTKQEPEVTPLDGQMREAQDGSGRKERPEMIGFELDGRERYTRLNAPLHLYQLDLKIDSGRQIRLLLSKAPQLGDLTGFGSLRGCLRFCHGGDSSALSHGRYADVHSMIWGGPGHPAAEVRT